MSDNIQEIITSLDEIKQLKGHPGLERLIEAFDDQVRAAVVDLIDCSKDEDIRAFQARVMAWKEARDAIRRGTTAKDDFLADLDRKAQDRLRASDSRKQFSESAFGRVSSHTSAVMGAGPMRRHA